MAGKKQKQEGVGAWIAIVILFAVGLWPIALVMLLVKLFGNDGQKRRPAPAADGGAGAGGRRIRRDCRQDQKGRAQRHEVPGGEEV